MSTNCADDDHLRHVVRLLELVRENRKDNKDEFDKKIVVLIDVALDMCNMARRRILNRLEDENDVEMVE